MRDAVGNVEFVGSFARELPELGLPEVAFAGRSNVGKSTALNRLLNRKSIARVSRTPGRTQLINLFRVGDAVVFADLPGYGFAKVPAAVRDAWKPMIEGYLSTRERLKLVVVLVDSRLPAQEMDGQLIYALTESRVPSLVVATKCDKLGKQEQQRKLAALRKELRLPAGQPIPFSGDTGLGRDAVWDAIEAACASAEDGVTPPA